MSTMNISLTDSLKAFVDTPLGEHGFGTSSEYVRELIQRDQDRVRLRAMLLAGAASLSGEAVTPNYFDKLRAKVGAKGKAARTTR